MTSHDVFWPPSNKNLPATSARTCRSPQDHSRSNMEASRFNFLPTDKHVVEMQPRLDFLLTPLWRVYCCQSNLPGDIIIKQTERTICIYSDSRSKDVLIHGLSVDLLLLSSGWGTSNSRCSCSWFHCCFSKVKHMAKMTRRIAKSCSFRISSTYLSKRPV